jgi:hypothetical protein
MPEDAIVAEVRKIRDELAAKFGYDPKAILRDAMKRQRSSGHKVVNLAAKRRRRRRRDGDRTRWQDEVL